MINYEWGLFKHVFNVKQSIVVTLSSYVKISISVFFYSFASCFPKVFVPGRLQVSNIDGKNMFNQLFQNLEAFGGRGFSVWDTSNLASPIYDSEGTLEEYMESFDKYVFNTDYDAKLTYQSPEQLRDRVSYQQVKHNLFIL